MSDGKEIKDEGPDSDMTATSAASGVEGISTAEHGRESTAVEEERDKVESASPSEHEEPIAESSEQAHEAADDEVGAMAQSLERQASAEATLAAMRLVEVDGAEGIRDAKRALGELEALLDEFENPDRLSQSQEKERNDAGGVITQAELDRRLEEVAAAVASASSKGGARGAAQADKGKKGGVVAAGIIGLTALVLSLVALMRQPEVDERLETKAQTVTQAAPDTMQDEAARLRMEFRQLTEKVNELSVMMDGPVSYLSERNEAAMAVIETRLARLEGRLAIEPGAETAVTPTQAAEADEAAASESMPAAGSGRWVINLTSFGNEGVADQEVQRLLDAGIPVEKQRAVSDGKVWYRLRITGLPTYERAKAYIVELKGQADTSSAWISSE